MNRKKIGIIIVIVSAVLLTALVAGAVIFDRFAGGKENDKPANENGEVTEEIKEDERPGENGLEDESPFGEPNTDAGREDKVENDDFGNSDIDIENPAVGDDTTESNSNNHKDSSDTKKPEETKKPQQNSSATQKEPVSNEDDFIANDNETTGEDKPYVPEPMTYAEFIELSAVEQQAYFESFDNIQDYFDWYNDALEKYEEEQNKIEGSGSVNIGDLIDGNGN
ncbi:MAG: hypothetical protein IJA52_01290 [Clostridia bacterium]|nr:hypothetical protein [Clostridia bacterium]